MSLCTPFFRLVPRRVHVMALIGFITLAFVSASWAQSPALTRITETKTVKVCIWPDYYGISYRNPKTGELSGIDIDMAKALALDLGVSLQFVDSSFAKLIDDLGSGQCDVAMFAIGITPARQAVLDFSKPHLASDIHAITTKSHRHIQQFGEIDQAGVVVAVAKGTLHETVMKGKLQHATLRVLDTPHAREQEVQSGRADVFMTDYPYSQRMLATTDWARLLTPEKPYHITPYAYAIKQGDPVWLDRINRFIDQTRQDGRLERFAQQHRMTPILFKP
jgi:cyclohexadienyl dehydratase